MAAAVKTRPNGGRLSEDEWTKTGTCLNKPDEGWIHPPEELEQSGGVSYTVRVSSFACIHLLCCFTRDLKAVATIEMI